MTRDSTSTRRAPLEPLPLSYFIPLDNIPTGSSLGSNPISKRSPSSDLLLSPTKRRILRQEGILNNSGPRTRSKQSKKTYDYDKITYSPENINAHASIGYNYSHSHSMGSDLFQQAQQTLDEGFRTKSTPSRPPYKASPRLPSKDYEMSYYDTSSLSTPRGPPPVPDRQSIHYPGFDVYYDPHASLPSRTSRLATILRSLDLDKEGTKENIKAERKSKKSASSSVATGGLPERYCLPSPRSSPLRSTPHRVSATRISKTPGPQRTYYTSPRVLQDAKRLGVRYGPCDRLSGKQALELEVNEVCSDDES